MTQWSLTPLFHPYRPVRIEPDPAWRFFSVALSVEGGVAPFSPVFTGSGFSSASGLSSAEVDSDRIPEVFTKNARGRLAPAFSAHGFFKVSATVGHLFQRAMQSRLIHDASRPRCATDWDFPVQMVIHDQRCPVTRTPRAFSGCEEIEMAPPAGFAPAYCRLEGDRLICSSHGGIVVLSRWCANRDLHPDARFGRPACWLLNITGALEPRQGFAPCSPVYKTGASLSMLTRHVRIGTHGGARTR